MLTENRCDVSNGSVTPSVVQLVAVELVRHELRVHLHASERINADEFAFGVEEPRIDLQPVLVVEADLNAGEFLRAFGRLASPAKDVARLAGLGYVLQAEVFDVKPTLFAGRF